eukprot:gene13482-biopygen9979
MGNFHPQPPPFCSLSFPANIALGPPSRPDLPPFPFSRPSPMPARGGARPRPAPDASAAPRRKAQTLKAAFKAVEVKAMWETAQAMAEG